MSSDLADELERLIEHDAVWAHGELGRCAGRLAARPGEPAATLARCLTDLEARLRPGVEDRVRRDVESVLYPRLWKLVEAVRDGLPAGEQLNRVRALDRRLAELLGRDPA
jgi:hypothetical protein